MTGNGVPVTGDSGMTRRTMLRGAAGAAALTALGGPAAARAGGRPVPLWREAQRHGVAFGSAWSTRLADDADYTALINREAAVLFTEDDLLWYKLKPSRDAPLDFSYGDQFVAFAEKRGMLPFGAHLVWDEGFGDGWGEDELWSLSREEAEDLLYGIVRAEVRRYRGRMAGWIVANEVTSPEGVKGVRTDVPWYETIGPSYIAESFRIAHRADPHAVLVLNEFGFETVNQYGDEPGPRRRAALQVVDQLLADNVPVHAFGVQGHLLADRFAERFNQRAYLRFLSDIADRGLKILITEVDVLDDGLPADNAIRDRAVADVYRRYLDTVLQEPAVKSVMLFGLSDRYTWLEEDYPRDDGAPRRPLPYDDELKPKPAYKAVRRALQCARDRRPLWVPPRAR
jgi:endo-1,4-beta-xylanase